MLDVGIFSAILSILSPTLFWPFGTFRGHLIYFSPFWYVVPRKIWQPWSGDGLRVTSFP
jgi:hypothetical protein